MMHAEAVGFVEELQPYPLIDFLFDPLGFSLVAPIAETFSQKIIRYYKNIV